ncbi:MAG: ATP synthase subunit I [Chloroflexota bacterium]
MAYVTAGLSGLLLGIFYFGGLWLTVQKLGQTNRPTLFLMGSFILRTGLVLAGFYLVSDGRIELLAICLAAFLISRFFISRWQFQAKGKEKTNGHQPR